MTRVAGWSARHRKTAVLGWLALVVVVFAAGQFIGTKNLPSNDAGQAGRAEQALQHLNVTTPPAEDVLIQSRRGATFAADPVMRQATRQVVAALGKLPGAAAAVRSPFGPGGRQLVSADGRSALVTFKVPGDPANADTAVGPAQRAVAAVQAAHPGLRVREVGDASLDKAANSLIGRDSGRRS